MFTKLFDFAKFSTFEAYGRWCGSVILFSQNKHHDSLKTSFFLLISETAIGGRQKPELRFSPGWLR